MTRIFDCCMSAGAGEIDLLEIRLRELAPSVDVFVVVEASVTHAGAPKPMELAGRLREVAGRVGVARDRVRVVEVYDMPGGGDPWARERWQRECIWRGLSDARPNDVMVFSDADEIPSRDAVERYRPEMDACKLEQINCYYWLNCFSGGWGGSIIAPVWWMHGQPLSQIRNAGVAPGLLQGGGWHFSFTGGVQGVKRKLSCYAHQECNRPNYQDERWLRVALHTPIDIFRRGCAYDFVAPDDPRLPACVRDDRARFAGMVKDAAFAEKWISDAQICWLVDTCRRVDNVMGRVVEFGSWEGRSAVALARMFEPAMLYCVDTWEGNKTEGEGHETVVKAKQRAVYPQFLKNMGALTAKNFTAYKADCLEFVRHNRDAIRFAHIDAAHDYPSVRDLILALQPSVPVGGVLCGDDFVSASASRADLQGGVERAVRETCPGFEQIENFWIWQRR